MNIFSTYKPVVRKIEKTGEMVCPGCGSEEAEIRTVQYHDQHGTPHPLIFLYVTCGACGFRIDQQVGSDD